MLINPLNAKLNPICHLLALLGAHHILHVSRIEVNQHLKIQPFAITVNILLLSIDVTVVVTAEEGCQQQKVTGSDAVVTPDRHLLTRTAVTLIAVSACLFIPRYL